MAIYAGIPGALVCLAVCIYQLSLPNVLFGYHEYDDGVYLGAAMRFVHGVMPYKDFVIVHPPGIMLLMAPIALIGGVVGSDNAMALARDCTVLVTALNCLLAALAVRHRGRVASLFAGLALACFPMAPAADSTLFLEPYLVFFSLSGIVVMFQGGRLAPPRRLLLAGAMLGFAGAVKVWAAFVIAAAAFVCIRQVKQALVPLLLGSSIGFGVACLPFFAMAPHEFLRDVLGDQFDRVTAGGAGFSSSMRILWVTGLYGLTVLRTPQGLAVLLAGAFVLFVGLVYRSNRRELASADRMIFAGSVASVAAMWGPKDIYAHYVYFPAGFLAMLLGIAVGMAVQHPLLSGRTVRRGIAALTVATVAFLLPQQADYARDNLAVDATSTSFLNLFISPGSCVVTDDVSLIITANVFRPKADGCPAVIDAYGTWLANGPEGPVTPVPGHPQIQSAGPFAPVFVNEWARWLSQSDWMISSLSKMSTYIPWTPALRAWFGQDFHLVAGGDGLWLYKHAHRTAPPLAG